MSNLTRMRLAAREIFDEALRAVDVGVALRNRVRIEGSCLTICETIFELARDAPVFAVAIGKAAAPMAQALDDLFGGRLTEAVITGPATSAGARNLTSRWHEFDGGHPLPTESSLSAAGATFSILDRANKEGALVVFLISGGGSAMMEWPIADDITLEDLQAANRALVVSGASIAEINSIRRAFSAVKGGRLAARAPNSQQITLIVSDVPKGEERNVASGPTLTPPTDAPQAIEVVERYHLREKLPLSIIRAIENAATAVEPQSQQQKYFVLLDNDTALEAAANAARRQAFLTQIAGDITDEPIESGCEKLLARTMELRASAPPTNDVCLLSGGEFACPVRRDGIGGRNLETALRLACSANLGLPDLNFVALCAGTDGIDGNSPAAGAIVDNTTIERARKIGLDAADFLNRSDAYSFFVALGDVITTGPTGTNVRDVRVLIRSAGE